jgi:hypothetical protein
MSASEAFSGAQAGQLTAENLSVEVGDVSFAYRRFGNGQAARRHC